ncbi:glycosyltransferase [Methylorubrum extorquens]
MEWMQGMLEKAIRLKLFDSAYYSMQAGEIFANSKAAFDHFHTLGWKQNFNPSRLFDTRFYIQNYLDVRGANINPLIHYIQYGRLEGRNIRLGKGAISEKPRAPGESDWHIPRLHRAEASTVDAIESVDIVIPVYRGYDDTLACIFSVITSVNKTPYRLIVIDDQSPDAKLSRMLDVLSSAGHIHLLRNPTNVGFVGTTNRGMLLSRYRDVVLLNSDTVVYGDWLDRLRYHAKKDSNIATVTPFSNNATILSYPNYLANNNTDLEVSYEDLDRMFFIGNSRRSSSIITGVGFCFYINRSCIEQIGVFNAELFGRGYGEENDFCRRAEKSGWQNLAAWDVFVQHTGEISFHDSALASKAAGYAALLSVHPEYDVEVQAFIAEDSLLEARTNVDLQRIAAAKKRALFIEHGRGGGTDRHIKDLAEKLGLEDFVIIHGRPGKANTIMFSGLGSLDLPNLPTIPLSDKEGLLNFIEKLNLDFVHIHSLLDFDLASIAQFCIALSEAGLPLYYTVHDYASICPKITMTDWSGMYCDSVSEAHCRHCLLNEPVSVSSMDIAEWRSIYRDILNKMRKVIVPHADVADRLKRFMPNVSNVIVRQHFGERSTANTNVRPTTKFENKQKKVAVIGAIGPHKGSGLLLRIAADAHTRQLPLRFKLYGYSDRRELNQFSSIEITGKYLEDEISSMLLSDRPDLVLLPSIWPETYCYTLDIAFKTMIHPVVFDIGAQAARVHQAQFGTVVPLSFNLRPSAFNDFLMSLNVDEGNIAMIACGESWKSERFYYDHA